MGDVASYLTAFQVALDLGERWGLTAAEEGAALSLRSELLEAAGRARGHVDLSPIQDVMPWHDEKTLYMAVSNMLNSKRSEDALPEPLRRLSSFTVPELLGPGLRNEAISYRNPVEILIGGAAFAMWGTVQVLRMVRDWSARRRIGEAAAEVAEAGARQAKTRADVIEHLGREVIEGRLALPPAQLAALVSSEDLSALQSLTGPEASLELPDNVAALFNEPSSS